MNAQMSAISMSRDTIFAFRRCVENNSHYSHWHLLSHARHAERRKRRAVAHTQKPIALVRVAILKGIAIPHSSSWGGGREANSEISQKW